MSIQKMYIIVGQKNEVLEVFANHDNLFIGGHKVNVKTVNELMTAIVEIEPLQNQLDELEKKVKANWEGVQSDEDLRLHYIALLSRIEINRREIEWKLNFYNPPSFRKYICNL